MFIRRSDLPKGVDQGFRHASIYWARMAICILCKTLYCPQSVLRIKFKFLSWHPKHLIWHLLPLQPHLSPVSIPLPSWHPELQLNWNFLVILEWDAFTCFSLQIFSFGWETWEIPGNPQIAITWKSVPNQCRIVYNMPTRFAPGPQNKLIKIITIHSRAGEGESSINQSLSKRSSTNGPGDTTKTFARRLSSRHLIRLVLYHLGVSFHFPSTPISRQYCSSLQNIS